MKNEKHEVAKEEKLPKVGVSFDTYLHSSSFVALHASSAKVKVTFLTILLLFLLKTRLLYF